MYNIGVTDNFCEVNAMLRTSTLYSRLKAFNIPCSEILSMSNHTSMQVGGIASVVAFVRNAEELITAIREAKNQYIKYVVIGNGSNVVFSDHGFDGLVIITNNMKNFTLEGNVIKADCGASISKLAIAAQKAELSGLEFAYGIPGTIGGGLFMNAGAFGGNVSDVAVSSICYDTQRDTVRKIDLDEHEFNYRESIYSKNPHLIILAVMLELVPGKMADIIAKMNQNVRARKEKQPLEFPSAGSVFKRPAPDLFVGKMIEDSGLKGYTVGGAQVSEKHAGFIINVGSATAKDVLDLVEYIKKVIRENYGVELECEIRRVGKGE